MQAQMRELEGLINGLAGQHGRLAELLQRQRQAVSRAEPSAIAAVGREIEELLRQILDAERRGGQLCLRLGAELGIEPSAGQAIGLTSLAGRIGGQAERRLQAAAAALREQVSRVGRTARVNQSVARRLVDFCADFLGQLASFGRQTGCYDRHGNKALAGQTLVAGGFSATA